MIFGRDRHIGREWARLQEAEEKYGKKSREYTKALSRWIKFLKAEAFVATRRAYREMEALRRAGEKAREAKALHGENSPQFEKALKRFNTAGAARRWRRRTACSSRPARRWAPRR